MKYPSVINFVLLPILFLILNTQAVKAYSEVGRNTYIGDSNYTAANIFIPGRCSRSNLMLSQKLHDENIKILSAYYDKSELRRYMDGQPSGRCALYIYRESINNKLYRSI